MTAVHIRPYLQIHFNSKTHKFSIFVCFLTIVLDDRTNGLAIGTLLRLSVVCLSSVVCRL